MKKSLYFLFILALFCLTGCKDALVPKPIKLTCNINTFDAPISCISRSTADADKLYIGQEDGCIIEKVNNNCQTYSINSNRRIYDILEYSEDSLFVGTRDAGLKLLAKSSRQTQTYYIKNKRMNYSVYSMALDDDKQYLYVGTSNGLFRLNLKDGSTSHELTPIQLGKCSKNCGVNKVVIKEKKLYVASEQGLFVVRNLEKDFKRPVIDSLVTNVSVYNDTVYALLENSVFKISPDGKKTLVRKGRCYLYAQGPDKDEWFISANSILYVKDGCTLEYDLPNGISTIARQIGFMGKDFLHLACREAMLSFALRQNSADLDNNVLAVSDKRTGDSIFFITDDLRLHLYKFVYNHPEFKSKSLGKIEGLDIVGNDIIKFLGTSPNTFFLATRKKLYKIKGNRAECLLQFSNTKGQNNITSLYYSTAEHCLYVGTREYLGIIDEQQDHIVTPIPVVSDKGVKDTIDAYITGICENEDSIYVTTLNKGLYGRPLNRPQESFWQICDLSGYESVYGVIMNGRNKYLNTSLGIVNEENATLLPVKHVKSISGALEKNPNEGFFILYYYGMSFKGLDDAGVPEPLFCDLAFSKPCIAVNGRKAVLGCKSGLFLFDGKSGLLPISIEKEEMSYALYIILSIAVLLSAFLALFLLKRRKKGTRKALMDKKGINPDNVGMNWKELEMDVHKVDKKVKTLFDALGYRKTEGEDDMRQELKQVCLDFADKYPELGKLSFMKRRGKERYFITILLMIEDIDAAIISRVLDVDQATVTRHKYNVRKEIEQLYPDREFDCKVINLLYDRINSRRK